MKEIVVALVAAAAGLVLTCENASAQDATWTGAVSGDWQTDANWNPAQPTGVATFGTSGQTTITFSNNDFFHPLTVDTIQLNAGAPVYTFRPSYLSFTGAGIVNNSTNAPILDSLATLRFLNASSAANATILDTASAGTFTSVEFHNTSTADHASITQTGATAFYDTSTAGSATINTAVLFAGNGGFTSFNDSSRAGQATINNSNGARTLFFNNSTAESAHITNAGILGGPTATPTVTSFVDSSTAANATIVNTGGGRTQFQNTATAGAASITSGGMDTATGFNSAVTFQNSSTADNATIINNQFGIVGFLDTSTAANASITNNNGGITFSNASTAGNATITTNNGGQTSFADNSTAGNARLITNAGGVVFFTGTGPAGDNRITAGSIEGAGVFFLGSNTLTVGGNGLSTEVSGEIQGSGSLAKIGTGTLTLSGNNFYFGMTTISGGVVQLGNGGASGSLLGDVAFTAPTPGIPAAALVFDRSDTYAYAGTISGQGNVVVAGTGRTELTAASSYTGTTTINAGILDIRGSIATSSLTTVNSGAMLTGDGVIGNTTIANGGTFAPGNGAPGSAMTVAGSLAFQAGASYLVQVTPQTSSSANVTGTATLGGATVNAMYANGDYVARQYTILTAGGINGTFGSLVDTNLPSNFHTTLSYDANHAYLDLALTFVPPPGRGLSRNQQGVANAIVGFFDSNGGIPLVFGGLTPVGLNQLAGETATGVQQSTVGAMTQFMGVMTDPYLAGRGDGVPSGAVPFADESDSMNAYATPGTPRSASEREAYAAIYRKAPAVADALARRWSVWSAGFGGAQSTDGNAATGASAVTSQIYGTAIGADYRLSADTLAGFALAGGGTSFSVAGIAGSGRSDLFQAGAYIRHTVGPSYISAALAYGWQDVTTDRTVTVLGADQLRAKFDVNAFSGRLEGGYRYGAPWIGGIGVTPYAAGQFTRFDLPAYAEQAVSGANTFALGYDAKSVAVARSELGFRTDKSLVMADAIVTLRGRAAWAHDFNSDRTIAATFQTLPGASFIVSGAAQAHDAALTTASLEMKWLNGWSAAGTFEGEFSDVTRSYAGKGVLRYAW